MPRTGPDLLRTCKQMCAIDLSLPERTVVQSASEDIEKNSKNKGVKCKEQYNANSAAVVISRGVK